MTDKVRDKMEEHESDVVIEKRELEEKARALSEFIGLSRAFELIDSAEQERLKEQNDIMWQYSEILGERITNNSGVQPLWGYYNRGD